MRKLVWVIVGTVFLLGLLLFANCYTLKTKEKEIQFSVNSATTIKCWEDKDKGILFVFLPSFAELNTTTVHVPAGTIVRLNGKELIEGMSCGEYDWNKEYVLNVIGAPSKTLVFMHSDNISSIHLNTLNKESMNYVHRDKNHKEFVDIILYSADGETIYQGDSLDKIRGHGNSTWRSEKKPYNIYLNDPAALTGTQPSDKWVLLSNPSDATSIRNKLVFDFARMIRQGSWFSPECSYVDLYVNGNYYGLYLLCEHVESTAEKQFGTDDDHSWILYQYELMWRLDADKRIVDPNGEGIEIVVPDQYSKEDAALLLDYLNAIYQERDDKYHSTYQLDDVLIQIDEDSWCRKYLIEEIFCNADAGKASQFFALNKKEGRVYAGPCWDYDQCLGKMRSVVWWSPNSFWASQASTYRNVIEIETVHNHIIKLYREEFSPKLHKLLCDELGKYIKDIESASQMNLARWPEVYDDKSDTIDSLVSFLTNRIEFLDKIWIDECNYHSIRFAGFYASPLCVVEGEPAVIPDPQEFGLPEGTVWIRGDTGEEFERYQETVNHDIVLRAYVPENNSHNNDSMLEEDAQEALSLRARITLLSLAVFIGLLIVLILIDVKRYIR